MRLGLVLWALLAGCAVARAPAPRYDRMPSAQEWGPHLGAPLEWWYVSGVSPEAGVAFHAAFFRAQIPSHLGPLSVVARAAFPGTYSLASLSVTDVRTGERQQRQETDFPIACGVPCGALLTLHLPGWTLSERTPGGTLHLAAGDLEAVLTPLKPRTVHPPGWTGADHLGHLAYQSVTRLALAGRWRGRPFEGLAWMDHQWGDLIPGRDARWDWHGLHLSDGSDLMLYDLTRPDGSGRVTAGTLTDPAGVTRALSGLTLVPTRFWRAARRRAYALEWDVVGPGLSLRVRTLLDEQEVPSLSGVTYWEGPVRVSGVRDGRPVTGTGMGEHLPWPWAHGR